MTKPPAEQLRAIAETWRYNRTLYPGWLIAPETVRNRLWSRTSGWMHFFITHGNALGPLEGIDVLSELNWRLETALSPIWDSLAPQYVKLLSAVNPYPEQLKDLDLSAITPNSSISTAPDWPTVQRNWLELACGILRYFREERKKRSSNSGSHGLRV